tara:strand:- start:2270 stop:2503 length:234 start_codon:yes stop_codon:yes gene_type:complete
MAIIEIHLKNEQLYKVEGQNAIVYVHDHDINEITTMTFQKQEKFNENWKHNKSIGISSNNEDLDPRQRKDSMDNDTM